jgi:hypothetical protein
VRLKKVQVKAKKNKVSVYEGKQLKLNIKLEKILKSYGTAKRKNSTESERSISRNGSRTKYKLQKQNICLTTRAAKSPLKLSKKSIKVVKGKNAKKGNQTQRSNTTLSSQLTLQIAAKNWKLDYLSKERALKTSRSRNHDKIGETINASNGFHTHRVQNNESEESGLLGMFTSFLTSDKKTINERKVSQKSQNQDLAVIQKNLCSTLDIHKDDKVDEKSQDVPINGFNIFKGSWFEKVAEKPVQKDDPFNLLELNHEILSFDGKKFKHPKASFKYAEDTTREDIGITSTDYQSPGYSRRNKHKLSCETEERTMQFPLGSTTQFNNYL